jgi:hypothetical protein
VKENGHFLEAEMSVFLEDEFTEYFVDGEVSYKVQE